MRVLNKIGVWIIFGAIATSFAGGSSCDSEAFMEDCAGALGEFQYIKMFPIQSDGSGDKSKSKYVLSKGNKYRFVTCDQDIKGNKMKLKLLDRNQKMLMSNYVSSSRKYYKAIDYVCTATGVYYLEAGFKTGKEGCGVIMLGFTVGE